MLTKADLTRKLKVSLDGVRPGDLQTIHAKIQEHLVFCSQHYDELDDEAKATVDSVFDVLEEHVEKAVQSLPESQQKRELVRLHARASGKHHGIAGFVSLLEQPPQSHLKVPFTQEAGVLFEEGIQKISDFLFDVGQSPVGFPLNICFPLFYQCLDELLAGMHLARHAYCVQAYSHARTTLECLDKIELFVRQPQWVDLWTSNDEKRIYDELKPSAVRKKLGNPPHDPLYQTLSRLGTHATFKALQARMAFRPAASGDERGTMHVWYGGSPQVHHMLWVHFHILYGVLAVLLKVVRIFGDRLNQGEVLQFTEAFVQRFATYLLKHFIPWAKENGFQVDEIEQELRGGLAMFGLTEGGRVGPA